ncbi:MAG: aldo/keto reductase [Candidatus Paceibacterota bacterium]|jgi:aryl-alcohol dehydrogenase-like predicted oxidoreductase
MKYRKLGDTGLIVSEIGFGAWGIGGLSAGATSYGETNDDESCKALKRAYDLGVNFYDTSDLYGAGHSEELIGEALKAVRDKVIIATKVGFLEHRGQQDFKRDYIRKSLVESLKRLKTDYVDLYQLHSPDIKVVEENNEILETLQDLKKEGKIRVFGISVRHPDDALVAVKKLNIKSIQANFNIIDQRIIENGLFELAKDMSVGIIARTPLNFGFLSGKLNNTTFGPGDHRSAWPKSQLIKWAEAPRLFSFLSKGKLTPVQVALNFCLSFEAVSVVIPGMLTEAEVEENVIVSSAEKFTRDELMRARKVYNENDFFERNK